MNIRADLHARFLCNLTDEERNDRNRFLYHILHAQWFYQKHYEKRNNTHNGKNEVSSLYKFAIWLVRDFDCTRRDVYQFFRSYLYRIPVCGAIIYKDSSKSHWLTVRSSHGKRIGFPKGKINRNEGDLDCALREVREETGLDLSSLFRDDKNLPFVEFQCKKKRVKFYILTLPSDFLLPSKLQPLDSLEIAECQWTPTSTTSSSVLVEESRRAISLLMH